MTENSRQRITKAVVDRLQLDHTIRDTELRGFGVRRQQGQASYFLQKRVNGRVRWITIGIHGSPWTPESARKEAHRLLGRVADGQDPQTERQQDRAKPTVREAAEKFLANHGPKVKPLTRAHYKRMLAGHVLPKFGTRKIEEIVRSDVSRLHAAMVDSPSAANATLAVLSKFMTWAEMHGLRSEHSNPCRGIKKYREKRRERFLSREEFAKLGEVLDRAEADQLAGLFSVAAIRLLTLTGARLNEILTLKWSYVDLERGALRLPDSKTGQKSIRLSAQAVLILTNLPRLNENAYVLPGHITGQPIVNLQKAWRRIRGAAGLHDVRIHDLRHSFASVAAASGASLPMIGALLGHSQPQTTARYAHLANDPLNQLNQDIGDVIAASMATTGRVREKL